MLVPDIFPEKYNCAQTVLRMILVEKDIYFPEVPWVAAGFGGGIGRRGEMCGAITGAIMAIGILHSQEFKDPAKHRGTTYNSVQEFIDKFSKKHDTSICNDLIGIDITNPEQRKQASESGTFKTICPPFVETAIQIVLEMFPE